MADPVSIILEKDVWTLVAKNVTSGIIEIQGYRNQDYRKDYRMSGEPAPTEPNETSRFVRDRIIEISATDPIDVYLQFVGDDDQDAEIIVNL